MKWLSEKRRAVALAYAEAGMNVQAAARALGVSPDTVRYHLDAIKRRTGLDPKNFWDLARMLGLQRKEDNR